MFNFQLKCKDLGFNSCDFISTGNSENELKRKFYYHSIIDHKKEFERMAEESRLELDIMIKKIVDDQSYN